MTTTTTPVAAAELADGIVKANGGSHGQHFHTAGGQEDAYTTMEATAAMLGVPRGEYDPTFPEVVADGLRWMWLHHPKLNRPVVVSWFDRTVEDVDAMAARFAQTEPGRLALTLARKGRKRVVLVVADLIDLYNGRRYALQTPNEDLGGIWHTEAIIHSEHTAAEWVLLAEDVA